MKFNPRILFYYTQNQSYSYVFGKLIITKVKNKFINKNKAICKKCYTKRDKKFIQKADLMHTGKGN